MPNNLKCKLKKLRYKGKISEEEFNELIDKLNGHDARLMERQYNALAISALNFALTSATLAT